MRTGKVCSVDVCCLIVKRGMSVVISRTVRLISSVGRAGGHRFESCIILFFSSLAYFNISGKQVNC